MALIESNLELNPALYQKIDELNKKVIYNKHTRVKWKQISEGFYLLIGTIDSRPVYINFSFAIINDKKICFYDSTSQVVDHKMIEEWLSDRFDMRNHTSDAINFHNCIWELDRL